MKSKLLLELQNLANELDYNFFICDNTVISIVYASTSFLRMMKLSEYDIQANPQCWLSRMDDTEQNIIRKIKSFPEDEGGFQFELPLLLDHGDSVPVQFRISGIQSVDDRIYRFGSAAILLENDIYKKEALQSRDNEIEISARIQKTLLTGEITQSGADLEIAADTLPSNKVDGDFYEFLWLTPKTADFIIGDVMGKGVPAALMAAGVKSSFFKALISHGGVIGRLPEIQEVLKFIDSSINRDLIELEKFLTLYYCRLDMEKSLLSFIDAGHTCFIYHDAQDNSSWSIKGANMPLGFILDQDFRKYVLPLNKGDLLFFYSDGISEVTNTEGELFGQERIMQLIHAHNFLNPEELIRKVLNVTFFFAAHDFEDDVTAISIKIKKDRSEPLNVQTRHFESTSGIDLSAIREDFSHDLLEFYGPSSSEISTRLLIALMEVLANCISYTDSNLQIKWKLYRQEVNVSVSFSGPDFNWFINPRPDIDLYQQRGFGSYLINEGTDSALLLYGRSERKRIVLIKEMV